MAAAVALAVLATVPGCGRRERQPTTPEAAALPARWRAADGEFLLGGIQVDEPDHERWIRSLAAAGFNTVAVTVYARQGDWDSASLEFEPEIPGVVHEIRLAKAAGLRVVLVLRVMLDSGIVRNRFLWHGMIQPRDDAAVSAWFDRYREFTSRWAAIAQSLEVDVLGIASELSALASTREVVELPELEAYYLDPAKQAELRRQVSRFEHVIDRRHLHGSWRETYPSVPAYIDDQIEAHRRWAEQVTGWHPRQSPAQAVEIVNQRRRRLGHGWEELIAAVRAVYHGEITYAANFDQYTAVGFWPSLDLIGINAYFPLRTRPAAASGVAALEPELEASWRRILAGLDAFRAEVGAADRPVLFTELGYTSRLGATLEPWSSRGFSLVGDRADPELMVWDEGERSFEERALAVRALRRAAVPLVEEGAGASEPTDRAGDRRLLRGLLWWKLSTLPEHEEIEPFVLVIGDDAPPDPLRAELRALRSE